VTFVVSVHGKESVDSKGWLRSLADTFTLWKRWISSIFYGFHDVSGTHPVRRHVVASRRPSEAAGYNVIHTRERTVKPMLTTALRNVRDGIRLQHHI
jgi:hypothetical protein